MAKPVKVFNKGTRPIVFKRDLKGVDAIHPLKFLTFNSKVGNAIIDKFEDACSEDDFKKFIAEAAKKIEEDRKNSESSAKKKVKKEV